MAMFWKQTRFRLTIEIVLKYKEVFKVKDWADWERIVY